MIDGETLKRRWEAAWSIMADENYDALILSHGGYITKYGYLAYFTGYSTILRSAYGIIFPGQAPIMVMPTKAQAYLAKEKTGLEAVRAGTGDVVAGEPALGHELLTLLDNAPREISSVGVAGLDQIMNVEDYRYLTNQLEDAKLENATDGVLSLKKTKEDEEINQLRETASIADGALKRFLDFTELGVSGWEIRGEMEQYTMAQGAKEVLTFVARGPYFLYRPSEAEIQKGDLLTVYSEVVGPNDYWAERAFVVSIGEVGDRKREIAEASYEALEAAEAQMVAGNTAADVAHAVKDVASRTDVNAGIWHGHGVGVDHDRPVLSVNNDETIEEGTVISVHPNFTDEAHEIGASVADTYLVTADGPERLSTLPRKFRTIDT